MRAILEAVLLIVISVGAWYTVQLRAENTHLKSELAARQRPAAPRMEPATANGRHLEADKRTAMVAKLGGTSPNPIWFATVTNNREAAAFEHELQSAFEAAGWQVRGNAPVTFPLKPGIFVFAADEQPPPYVQTALDALDAGGLSVTSGTGYRAFYRDKRQENPNWRGFELQADQTYIVVIGPQSEATH